MNERTPTQRSRITRGLLAFLWLTVGYWFISLVVPFALIFLPFARSGGGITQTSGGGVHTIRFHGTPGDVVALLITTTPGDKHVTFDGPSEESSGSSTSMRWANGLFELLPVVLFSLLSIPILQHLFRNDRKQS